MGGVLAIDLGAKKSGFAVADPERIVTQPLDVVRAAEDSAEIVDAVAGLLAERDVSTLLVGLPVHLDGSDGARAAAARAFAARLVERFPGVEVVTYDERLTTKEAEALLRDAGFTGREAKERRDSWSALVLLRDWIESGEPRG